MFIIHHVLSHLSHGMTSVDLVHSAGRLEVRRMLRGGPFEGGGGWGGGLEDFEKKFPAPQGERKKYHAVYNRGKKISCKRERSKKIPT